MVKSHLFLVPVRTFSLSLSNDMDVLYIYEITKGFGLAKTWFK
jgi:hypothetical protein